MIFALASYFASCFRSISSFHRTRLLATLAKYAICVKQDWESCRRRQNERQRRRRLPTRRSDASIGNQVCHAWAGAMKTGTYREANSSGFLSHTKAPAGAEAFSPRRSALMRTYTGCLYLATPSPATGDREHLVQRNKAFRWHHRSFGEPTFPAWIITLRSSAARIGAWGTLGNRFPMAYAMGYMLPPLPRIGHLLQP